MSDSKAVYVGTKLSQNPNYGRPSAKRLRERMAGWAVTRNSWKLLREIHAEIDATKPKGIEDVDSIRSQLTTTF